MLLRVHQLPWQVCIKCTLFWSSQNLLHCLSVCYLYLSTCLYVQTGEYYDDFQHPVHHLYNKKYNHTTVREKLTLVSDAGRSCICPGDVVTYKCTVMSGSYGATIFRGNPSSFYDCTGDSNDHTEIVLHHALLNFNDFSTSTCNNGTVIGQSLSNDNSTYYTSQLNITITSELIGDTIECIHDNGTHSDIVIGRSKLNNTGTGATC